MAGFSLGEADILRRAIGKKNSDAIAAQKEKFVQGALTKGYKQEDAETVYDYIESLPTMDLTNLTRWLMRCCLIN